MATLLELIARRVIDRVEVDLDVDEHAIRTFLATQDFLRSFDKALRREARDRDLDLMPFEQVEQLVYEFLVGRPMIYGQSWRKLEPLGRDVWELKTRDVRLFGYFPRKSVFLAVTWRMKRDLRPTNKSYREQIETVAAFRDSLDLDPPSHIGGMNVL